MEAKCVNFEQNNAGCCCTNTSCERHGICCACIRSHRERGYAVACMRPEALQPKPAEEAQAEGKV